MTFTLNDTFSLKGVKVKCEKIIFVAGELNPGSLALATSALATELWQRDCSKQVQRQNVKVLEVVGCSSSVTRGLSLIPR